MKYIMFLVLLYYCLREQYSRSAVNEDMGTAKVAKPERFVDPEFALFFVFPQAIVSLVKRIRPSTPVVIGEILSM
jgi:hypothetical protein